MLVTLISYFVNCNSGVAGVGAAVQSVQLAAEQSLSAAMMKMQVCVCRCKNYCANWPHGLALIKNCISRLMSKEYYEYVFIL